VSDAHTSEKSGKSARPREARSAYLWSTAITTRWMDNDAYGHVNNVTYYSYFDTAANLFLIREGGLDLHASEVIGLVVESRCAYHEPIAYPEPITAMVRVDHLGSRAVTWGIGIFREGAELAAAHGHFVHVFVDRKTRTAVQLPERIRAALQSIVVAPAATSCS
jgi:acyl-CoA thioester hydrolase